MRIFCYLAALACVILCSSALSAQLPSAQEVRDQLKKNQSGLEHLHLQATEIITFTEGFRELSRHQADEFKAILDQVENVPSSEVLNAEHHITAGYVRYYLMSEEKRLRDAATAGELTSFYRHHEVFVSGENYQVRSAFGRGPGLDEKTFEFPTAPATKENLATAFHGVAIHAWDGSQTPPARHWGGRIDIPVRVFDQHYYNSLPPWIYPIEPAFKSGWSYTHPYNLLLDRMFRSFDVVGFETIDGREVLVVHVVAETDRDETVSRADKTTGKRKQQFLVRARLDLTQGAVPVSLELWNWSNEVKADKAESMRRYHPQFAVSTRRVAHLENGAFYPAETRMEHLEAVPDNFTTKYDREAPEGMQRHIVRHSETWRCTLVEAIAPLDSEFFTLEFPADATVYNEELETRNTPFSPKDVRAGLMLALFILSL